MEIIASLGLCLYKIIFACIGFAAIGAIISFHELGHFLFCKLFNIYTPSFSIGFGPRLISKKIGTTEFSIRAIPLGGFVEIAGSAEVGQGEQKEAQRNDEYSFSSKPYYQRLLVMFGGILFNLLFAYIVFALFYWIGLPKTPILYPRNAKPIIEKIHENSIAQAAGLEAGDRVLAYNGIAIGPNTPSLVRHIQQHYNEPLSLTIERNNTTQDIAIDFSTPKTEDSQVKPMGLGLVFKMVDMPGIPFIPALREGIHLTNHFIYQTILGFVSLFKKRDVSQMAGPIGIISLAIKAAQEGLKDLLALLALISINLAILNLLPLPILDGGQIMFNTIEAIIGRPLPAQTKEYIFMGSWALIVLLIVYLSAKDIMQIFLRPLFRILGK